MAERKNRRNPLLKASQTLGLSLLLSVNLSECSVPSTQDLSNSDPNPYQTVCVTQEYELHRRCVQRQMQVALVSVSPNGKTAIVKNTSPKEYLKTARNLTIYNQNFEAIFLFIWTMRS